MVSELSEGQCSFRTTGTNKRKHMKIKNSGFGRMSKVGLVTALAVVTMVTGCGKNDNQSSNCLPLTLDFTPDAVEQYRVRADAGDSKAQYLYSLALSWGIGVAKDDLAAFAYASKSALQNFGLAYQRLGRAYGNGLGISSNAVDSAKWYKKAFGWALKSAKDGDVWAQCCLGVCYEDGNGIEKDVVEAVNWYRKAADRGLAQAQTYLGYCYEGGIGVEKNAVEAAKWYRKAAEQGYAFAQTDLGFCYENGIGVDKDTVAAALWYQKAADQGYEGARRAISQLELKLRQEKTLVFKGLYLGMNYKDAVEICEKQFGIFSGIKNVNGFVDGFELSRDDVDYMFNTRDISGRKFCECLLSAYPILEKFDVRREEIADVEAQEKYMREAEWRAAEMIMNGTIQNGDQAFVVGAAAGRQAQEIANQMTKFIDCYYYESNKGFVLEIRPEQPERFFVLRKIASVELGNFD